MEIIKGNKYLYTGDDFQEEVVECKSACHPGLDGWCVVSRKNGEIWWTLVENLSQIPLKTDNTMLLPTDAEERKQIPIVTGVLDYFPLAIAEVAKCSMAGNNQHHPNEPLFWDKTKSTDHADCIGRHLIDRGKFDMDGQRHSAKLAWRALALLQIELEKDVV